MQFLQELSITQQAALGGAIVVLLVLLLVVARKRKAGGGEKSEGRVRRTRRRDRAHATHVPRRKRRKLAAEAAQSMGVTEALPVVPVPDVPVAAAPEVPVAEVPVAEVPPTPVELPQTVEETIPNQVEAQPVHLEAEPAVTEAPLAPEPVAVPDDPYVQPAIAASNPFVAQPGWPAPGELASSFDPDIFDPVPESESLHEEVAQYDQFGATALDYMERTESFTTPAADQPVDVAADESDWETDANWTDDEDVWDVPDVDDDEPSAAEIAPAVASVVEDDWSDDSESAWDETETSTTAAWGDAEEVPEVHVDLESVGVGQDAHVDDAEADRWETTPSDSWLAGAPVEQHIPAESTFVVPTAPQSGAPSPVVLDLAGLAASGQSLELVIEPNADGQGVRLRIGAPRPAADVAPEPQSAESVPAPSFDGVWAAVDTDEAMDEASDDLVANGVHQTDHDIVMTNASDLTADDEIDVSDDDPAKILADIRARLAALDAAR